MAMKTAVAIAPKASGFGEWERRLGSERRVSSVRQAALAMTDGTIGCAVGRAIPVEELEADADIRGLVHDEPRDMYAVEDGFGGYVYFGII